jgi:hypothetical protein
MFGVVLGQSVMVAEELAVEKTDRADGRLLPPPPRGHDADRDPRANVLRRRHRPKKTAHGIREGPGQHVLELRMAENRKQLRHQFQFRRPRVPTRRNRVECLDGRECAIGIMGGDRTGDEFLQAIREFEKQPDASVGRGVVQRDRVRAHAGLVDGAKSALRIPRTPVVRDGCGEQLQHAGMLSHGHKRKIKESRDEGRHARSLSFSQLDRVHVGAKKEPHASPSHVRPPCSLSRATYS